MWYDDLLNDPEAEADYDAYLSSLYEDLEQEAAAERIRKQRAEAVQDSTPPEVWDDIPF